MFEFFFKYIFLVGKQDFLALEYKGGAMYGVMIFWKKIWFLKKLKNIVEQKVRFFVKKIVSQSQLMPYVSSRDISETIASGFYVMWKKINSEI